MLCGALDYDLCTLAVMLRVLTNHQFLIVLILFSLLITMLVGLPCTRFRVLLVLLLLRPTESLWRPLQEAVGLIVSTHFLVALAEEMTCTHLCIRLVYDLGGAFLWQGQRFVVSNLMIGRRIQDVSLSHLCGDAQGALLVVEVRLPHLVPPEADPFHPLLVPCTCR